MISDQLILDVVIVSKESRFFRAGLGLIKIPISIGFLIIIDIGLSDLPVWSFIRYIVFIIAICLFFIWFSRTASRISMDKDKLYITYPLYVARIDLQEISRIKASHTAANTAVVLVFTKNRRIPAYADFTAFRTSCGSIEQTVATINTVANRVSSNAV